MSGPPGRSPHHSIMNSRSRRVSLRSAILGVETNNTSNDFDLNAVMNPTFHNTSNAQQQQPTSNYSNLSTDSSSNNNSHHQPQQPQPAILPPPPHFHHHSTTILSPTLSASSSSAATVLSNPHESMPVPVVPISLPLSSYLDTTNSGGTASPLIGGDNGVGAVVSSSTIRRGTYVQAARDRVMARNTGGGRKTTGSSSSRTNMRRWGVTRRTSNNNSTSSSLTTANRGEDRGFRTNNSVKDEQQQRNSRRKNGVGGDGDDDSEEGGILVHGILSPPKSSLLNNDKVKLQEDENDTVKDRLLVSSPVNAYYHNQHEQDKDKEINNKTKSNQNKPSTERLRKLVCACLFSAYSTSSPIMAVFYASILYTQTRSHYDAYLYAQALYTNNEKKRAVFFLERSGLFHHHHNSNNNMMSFTTNGGSDAISGNNDNDIIWLTLEAILLGAKCLADLGEWEEVSSLLEDACRVPQVESVALLEEGVQEQEEKDNSTIHSILRLVRYLKGKKSKGYKREEVHPVARICAMRGKAYDEGSNPTRAASFLKLALKIDYKCVDAWIYLCQRHLLTWDEELNLVLNDINIEEQMQSEDGNEGDMDWLRDVYMSNLSNQSHEGNFIDAEITSSENDEDRNGFEVVSIELDGLQRKPFNDSSSPYDMMNVDASTIKLQSPSLSPSIHYGLQSGYATFGNGGTSTTSKVKDHVKDGKGTTVEVNETRHNSSMFSVRVPSSDLQVKRKIRVEATLEVERAFQNLYIKHNLSQSPEILTLAATRAYNAYNLPLALHHCQTLYEMDPLCSSAARIQIATLTGLGQKRPLFRLAHALVNAGPKSAVAWYAVGCYYHTCGRYDLAQRNFCRATRLDPRSAECWIAFGCAFASCDENDQANACFRVAHRLHSGSHYPMLYMGMEHLRTNNLTLAGHFLRGARAMGRNDPLCCNELGVWAYMSRQWGDAVGLFIMTLRLRVDADLTGRSWVSWDNIEEGGIEKQDEIKIDGQMRQRRLVSKLSDIDCIEICQEPFWEPTIFNLGQSFRKAKRYDEAILCFEKCLVLCPGKDSSYSALGFTRHIRGDVEGAIEAYHQALGRKPDDPFASEMLSRALQEAVDVFKPLTDDKFEGASGESAFQFGLSVQSLPACTEDFDMNRSEMSMSASVSTVRFLQGNGSDIDISMT